MKDSWDFSSTLHGGTLFKDPHIKQKELKNLFMSLTCLVMAGSFLQLMGFLDDFLLVVRKSLNFSGCWRDQLQ
jgi:hypothetical protein